MPNVDRPLRPEPASTVEKPDERNTHHDALRTEIFSRQTEKNASPSEIKQRWYGVVKQLELASVLAGQPDIGRANKEYERAFRIAESIDQNAIGKERINVQNKLKEQDLAPETRRKLIEIDTELKDAQRAPGIALANWGLALMRHGAQAEGTKLLIEAQSRDQQMIDDPNFRRHFAEATEASLDRNSSRENRRTDLARVDSSALDRELPPGFPQPIIQNTNEKVTSDPVRRIDAPMTPAYSLTGRSDALAQAANPNAGCTDAPLASVNPVLGQTDAPLNTANPIVGRIDAPLTTANPAAGRTDAPASAAAAMLLEVNEKFKAQAEAGNPREAFKQSANLFVQTINRADQEFVQRMKEYPDLVRLTNIPENQMSPEQRSQIEKSLVDFNSAVQGRFVTRLCMAQAAEIAGDKQQAAAILTAAFSSIPPAFQNTWLQNTPALVALSQKLGLNQEMFPIAPDQLLAQTIPAETRREANNAPDLNPANQGLRPDQMFDDGVAMVKKFGMTADTKKQFDDAITSADALFNKDDAAAIQVLQGWLRNGRKDNGETLSPKERVLIHNQICKSLDDSAAGLKYREVYGKLLIANKQNATAEKTFLGRIETADKLPLQLIRDEMDLLARDMSDPTIPRETQKDFAKRLEGLGGSTLSHDDGLLNAPIEARKLAAQFYMSNGLGDTQLGVFKPDKAIEMINETKAAELRFFGIDLNKNPDADATLRQMASEYEPFASEKLRNDKTKFDSYWSNGLIDIGVGAAGLTAAGLLASIATKNPKFFSLALNADKTALSLGGKAALAGTTLIGATTARHYLHKELTGLDEGWDKSLYHASAGLGTFAAVRGTRAVLNQTLFRGATEETLFVRYANARTAAAGLEGAESAGAQRLLKAKDMGEYYASQNIRVPQKTLDFIKANPEAVVVNNGVIQRDVFEAVRLGLNPAQSANLARGIAPQAVTAEAGAKSSLISRMSLDRFSTAPLDLTTATAEQLGTRAFLGNWAQASAGIAANNSLTALDREVDPVTGKMPGVGEAIWNANYHSAYDNTLVKGMVLGHFLFKNGVVPQNYYAKDATLFKQALGTATAPFRAGGWGATTAQSGYIELGRQAGYMVTATNVYDFETVPERWNDFRTSQRLQERIEASKRPVADQINESDVLAEDRKGLATGTPGLPR